MKIKYAVVEHKAYGEKETEIGRYDTEKEAEEVLIKDMPSDFLGTAEYYIRKIYTNHE